MKTKNDLNELLKYIEKNKFNDEIIINNVKITYETEKIYFGLINIDKLLYINDIIGHEETDKLIKRFEKHLMLLEPIDIFKISGQEWVYLSFNEFNPKFIFSITNIAFHINPFMLSLDVYKKLDECLYYKKFFNIKCY